MYTECMSATVETTIRVPTGLRDQIRAGAARHRLKQADYLSLALRELEQAEFLRSVAQITWDAEALGEARPWDEAGLAGELDPWEPGQ